MAEDDVLIRRYVVMTVFKAEGRCDFVLVDRQYFGGDEGAVEAVGQYEYECRDDNEIQTIHKTIPPL